MTEENEAEDWHRGSWMQTYTGKQFYPLSARVEDIDLIDIAHSLSLQCRYNGHVRKFYSVAEHCILMSQYIYDTTVDELTPIGEAAGVPVELALWALLHDAPEAYIGDMVRPLKIHMLDFCAVDNTIMRVIANKFSLSTGLLTGSDPIPSIVKGVDTRILLDERAELLGPTPAVWNVGYRTGLGVKIMGYDPREAEARYLDQFEFLMSERKR